MNQQSLKHIQKDIRSGLSSHVELIEIYLRNIKNCKSYNCYVEVFDHEALQCAQQLDEKLKNTPEDMGCLFGAVISIKDNICYKEHKASAGSAMLTNFISPYSATVVERLLEEDAIIIGRTNCDEFSMGSSSESSIYGPVLNAIDPSRVAGGSSGGAAVSVKLNTCLLAIGSDTGGSIRQPAAFNGLYGFKPSYGVISRWGLIAYASSFDQIGIISNDIESMNLCLDVISGPDEYDNNLKQDYKDLGQDSIKSLSGLRIAYFSDWIQNDSIDENLKQSTSDYISSLKEKGLTIHDIKFPYTDYLVPCYYILTLAEASSNLSRYDGIRYGHRTESPIDDYKELIATNRSEGFGENVKRRIIMGAFVLSEEFADVYYTKASKLRRQIKDCMEQLFSEYDIIICPITTSEAFKLGSRNNNPVKNYLSDVFTVLANLSGIPSLSVPIRNNGGDLPLGIQFLSRQFDDKQLLFYSNEIYNLA